mgnify:FL=1|tara:strand:+ start:783 stop:1013 length:231 start_codon:yes stop_codon:yes gene_type:complete
MKQFYKHGDEYYFVHRNILISHFANKEGVLNMDNVKIWRDGLNGVDHVLKTESHFLFVETIQDAEIIEEEIGLIEE